jgi:hypothetical protein
MRVGRSESSMSWWSDFWYGLAVGLVIGGLMYLAGL